MDADIGVEGNAMTLFKYKHGRDGYIVAVYASRGGPASVTLPERSNVLVDMASAQKAVLRQYVNSREFRNHVTHEMVVSQILRVLEDERVRIIPALPDPDNGKIYRLQVGAFSLPETAGRVLQRLEDAGFETAWEQYGSMQRVFAANIRAADVYSAVQRLGEAGFSEVWVRE